MPSAEIERAVLPTGNIENYQTDSAPCFLPPGEAINRRFKEAYPPYQWIRELFEKVPFEIIQWFQAGDVSVGLSTRVSFEENRFVYTYEVTTDASRPLYFLWTSTASRLAELPVGLSGAVTSDELFTRTLAFDSGAGPRVVLDLMVIDLLSSELPIGQMEPLDATGWMRIYSRLTGGVTRQQGSIGLKDWTGESSPNVIVFPTLSVVPTQGPGGA